jgi:hypothetical protein
MVGRMSGLLPPRNTLPLYKPLAILIMPSGYLFFKTGSSRFFEAAPMLRWARIDI